MNRTKGMNTNEAKVLVEERAKIFEQNKDYLIVLWDQADIDIDPNSSLETQ